MEQTREEKLLVKEQVLQEALEQRVSDFKHSFETPTGKRVYKYLSEFCFENESTFDAGSQSTCNFNEGSRFVILEIRKWLDMNDKKMETILQGVRE